MKEKNANEQLMNSWYEYAAAQPGSVDAMLSILRDRLGNTLRQQQAMFGADDPSFCRLRGMRAPRSEQFTSDAQRIAESCGLRQPFAFVRALLLARNIAQAPSQTAAQQYYQAAFDAIEDLDTLPNEE